MNRHKQEAQRWLRQAEYDLQMAVANRGQGFYALTCFLCQQGVEKALKAYLYAQGAGPVIGHSTYTLARESAEYDQAFESVFDICRQLDRHYIPTQYPNGLPDGIPHEFYTRADADQAIDGLHKVLDTVKATLSPRALE